MLRLFRGLFVSTLTLNTVTVTVGSVKSSVRVLCTASSSEVTAVWRHRNSIIIFFKPPSGIDTDGLKIDENKLKGYDAQSVQSGTGRLSCSRTALKRCTSTETR